MYKEEIPCAAVNKDGTEMLFKRKPNRGNRSWWCENILDELEVPLGTIQRLFGFEMTWEDEPKKLPTVNKRQLVWKKDKNTDFVFDSLGNLKSSQKKTIMTYIYSFNELLEELNKAKSDLKCSLSNEELENLFKNYKKEKILCLLTYEDYWEFVIKEIVAIYELTEN